MWILNEQKSNANKLNSFEEKLHPVRKVLKFCGATAELEIFLIYLAFQIQSVITSYSNLSIGQPPPIYLRRIGTDARLLTFELCRYWSFARLLYT